MPEPFTIAATTVVAAEVAGATATTAAVGAAETATAAALAEGTALIATTAAGELAAASEALAAAEVAGGLGAAGGTTEALIGALEIEAGSIGSGVLAHAETSGGILAQELGTGAAELGIQEVGAGVAEVASPAADLASGAPFDAAACSEARVSEGVVKPDMVADRFRPLREPANLESYVQHLEARDPAFAGEMSRRVEQVRAAEGPADLDAAMQQIRKSTAGQLGESVAVDGFRPYFNGIEVQSRVELQSGTTIIDGRLMEARQPVVLGRGLGVPEGGNLSIEVKTGQPGYLAREIPHIADKQVQGHLQVGDQSLVVMSRDVYGVATERAARDAVGAAGSRIMALLPEKATIDQALIRVIGERAGRLA